MNQIRITDNIRTFLAYTIELARRCSVKGLSNVGEFSDDEIRDNYNLDPETVSDYELIEAMESSTSEGAALLLDKIFHGAEDLGEDTYLVNLSKRDALACISSCRAVLISCCCDRSSVIGATRDMIDGTATISEDSILTKAAIVAASLEDLLSASLDKETKAEWETQKTTTAQKSLYTIDEQLSRSNGTEDDDVS